MAFKMKGSTHYGKGKSAAKMYGKPSPAKNYKNPQDYKVFNMGNKPSPAKDYSVDKGSHDHPHGDSPNKFLGGMMKKLGGAAKGMLKGKDGKFGIGDVGRLALGPMGAAAGATGLFAKEGEMKKDKEERNQFGETPAEYKQRMIDMGLREADKMPKGKMKKAAKDAVKGAKAGANMKKKK